MDTVISFSKTTMRISTLSLFLIILTISCAQIVDSNELFKNETVLKLKLHQTDSIYIDNLVDLEMIHPKVKELRNWIDNNETDWKSSIASFSQSSISVIGDDFRMLIFKDFVVIGFIDNKGKQKQFTKQTDYNDFKFLLGEK
ncbi:MAG: hypothetical protein JXB49_15560 [Bacteroidales bacterium]|nr:hypothetical protein [Bacteroidales bacterium]